MKKLAKIVMVLVLAMGMCACTPKPETPKVTIHEVIGTTFVNDTVQNDDLKGSLTLYKEGDFELYEYISGKLTLVRGDYKQRENEYDLYPQNCSELPEKIVFRATGEEEMILDTELNISGFGDVYIPEYLVPEKEPETYPMVFYSTAMRETDHGTTSLQLNEDGTFSLTEVQGLGALLYEGRYGKEGNVYMFSNFDPFPDMNGEMVHNFEFIEVEKDVLVLNEDLNSTYAGTLFTKTGKLPDGYEIAVEDGGSVLMQMIHASIDYVDAVNLPKIDLWDNGNFAMYENVYEGFATIYGHYEYIGKTYRFYVEDNSMLRGYAGEGITQFDIYHDDAMGGFRIDTDLCMTRSGDEFKLISYAE